MLIREEETTDAAVIHSINEAAFESPGEANLVDALREKADPVISLVAEADGAIAGHIMFSPVTLAGCDELIMGLAPMAVIPGKQRQGIGSALVREGLERCRQLDAIAVVVLGHPEYYPRFGFVPASRFGLSCEYEIPDEVFMAMELPTGSLDGKAGIIRYHEAFADV